MKNTSCLGYGLFFLIILSLSACGTDEYSDARKLFQDRTKIMEDFIDAIEKAESPQEMVPVIDAYTDQMEELIPEILYIKGKYPELAKKDSIPKSVKKDYDMMRETGNKMENLILGKVLKYQNDPDIAAAMQALAETSRKQIE